MSVCVALRNTAFGVQELLGRSEVQELEEKLKENRLSVATCCVTIVRYMSDIAAKLPVGILTRLLQTHDTISALLPLAESPPWRRERNGTNEYLDASQWIAIPASDRFRLLNKDAQVRPGHRKAAVLMCCMCCESSMTCMPVAAVPPNMHQVHTCRLVRQKSLCAGLAGAQ